MEINSLTGLRTSDCKIFRVGIGLYMSIHYLLFLSLSQYFLLKNRGEKEYLASHCYFYMFFLLFFLFFINTAF